MKCPRCQSDTSVKDTRPDKANTVRRRRVCEKCNHTFYTFEPPPHSDRPGSVKVTKQLREVKTLLAQLQVAIRAIERTVTW
jgi:transcriptional regulator NrdR family protein